MKYPHDFECRTKSAVVAVSHCGKMRKGVCGRKGFDPARDESKERLAVNAGVEMDR